MLPRNLSDQSVSVSEYEYHASTGYVQVPQTCLVWIQARKTNLMPDHVHHDPTVCIFFRLGHRNVLVVLVDVRLAQRVSRIPESRKFN